MELFFTALTSVSVLFIMIIIGFIAGRSGLISESGQGEITKLLVYVILPCTIINSMLREFDPNVITELLIMIGFTIASYFPLLAISYLITSRFKGLSPGKRDVLFAGAIMTNASFMGFPILSSLYGDEVIFFAALSQVLIFEIFSWTAAYRILERNTEGGNKKPTILTILLKPGIIASSIGLIIFISQVKLPFIITRPISMISPLTSPLAMILVGLMLSRSDIKKALSNKYLYYTSFIKLIIIPSVVLCALYFVGIRGRMLFIPVVEFAMPTAAYLAILSGLVKNDSALASEQVFVSSLFSVITIPVIVTLVNYLA